jgi:hypothetical protein
MQRKANAQCKAGQKRNANQGSSAMQGKADAQCKARLMCNASQGRCAMKDRADAQCKVGHMREECWVVARGKAWQMKEERQAK